MSYQNPTPVVVVIQPVRRADGSVGVILVRRTIEPSVGALVLPGGYQVIENWRDAGVRELFQEASIVVDPSELRPFGFDSTPDNKKVILFCVAPELDEEDLPPFDPQPNESGVIETSERIIASLEHLTHIPWSLHQLAFARFLRGDPFLT